MLALPYATAPGSFSHTALSNLSLVAFFASALLGSALTRTVLGWRTLVFVGAISYSMFLLHETILVRVPFRLLGDREGTPLAVFPLYTALVLALALLASWLCYRYVESPFLRRKPK